MSSPEKPAARRETRTPLRLRRISLSFEDPALERDYRAAWAAAMVRPLRVGIAVIAIIQLVGVLTDGLWLHSAEALVAAVWMRALGLVSFAALAAMTWWRPAAERLRDLAVAAGVPMSVLFAAAPWLLGAHGADGVGPTILVAFVGCSVLLRLGFVRDSILAAQLAIAFHIAVPHVHTDADRVAGDTLLFYVAVVLCLAASWINERRDRRLFLDERLLAEERARTEALLHQEVGHQVAARSRELGQALQKMDATLVVERLSVGDRFDGRYVVKRPLGAGGMGAVYEVERLTDGRRLALKIVIGEVTGAQAARFAREAEIGAGMRHPNLVPIVDVGVSAGVPFLVMEIADGGSLEDRRHKFGDAEWARPILCGIGEGLAALHHAGIVHRDLKPANVLFVAGGTAAEVPRISDFGISRSGAAGDTQPGVDPSGETLASHGARPAASGLTQTGAILGTPLYMAPEAARGGRHVDARADVFALGILACELLTGRVPFAVPPLFVAMRGDAVPPPDLTGIEGPLRPLVEACLASDPGARPSVRSFCDSVRAAPQGP